MSPEGAALILLKDPALAPQAAEALRLSPVHLRGLGLVDCILPAGSPDDFANTLRGAFLAYLRDLDGKSNPGQRMRLSV